MPKTYPVPLTTEEMAKLIEASMDDDFFYMLFMTAKTTGRRLGEYYDVQVKDVKEEPDGTKVMLTKVLKRRAKIEKEALLTDEVYRLIMRYIKQNNMKLDDYLFRKCSYRNIQARTKSYGKKAGIPHIVSFHNFRHYLITSLIKQGFSYDQVTKVTGHSSTSAIGGYDHSVARDIKDKISKAIKEI